LHKESGWIKKSDPDYKVPYIVKGNQFISYDDLISVKEKLDFLKSQNLGGATVMSIESDDFHNKCGDGKNSMTTLIKEQLNGV